MVRRPRHRRKHRRGSSNKDEPFLFLTFKVGCCILSAGWLVTHIALLVSFPKGRWAVHSPHSIVASPVAKRGGEEASVHAPNNATQFPAFRLNPATAKYDAFGIRDELAKSKRNVNSDGLHEFYEEISLLKREFASRYGGVTAARYLLLSGVTTFDPSADGRAGHAFDAYDWHNIPSGLKHTAHRLLSAREHNRPFKVAFGGYSVTVGRGNYFHQSYPFVMQKLLEAPMKRLGIELSVRNAAIGGVPSFPYGWCLDNFLGEDADVISWDYSMNEAGGVADGLEAYIRQGLSMKRRPLFIVKDTTKSIAQERYDLLQRYVDAGALHDPIVLGIEDAIGSFLGLKEEMLPTGFQDWNVWGAPKGAPGQTSHHPGVKEHELYGWLLAMHFIAVLELVAFIVEKGKRDNVDLHAMIEEYGMSEEGMLPPPVHGEKIAPAELRSLFYGYDATSTSASDVMHWKMSQVHCRTTYDPILSNGLRDVVVSGTAGEDLDIMLPRGAQLYNKGWVLDLGASEKTAKKKLERYGGLGYVDTKKAYYGIKSSGPLELFLPCLGRDDILEKMQQRSEALSASECFKNVVVCEVNEKHTGEECDLNKDLAFVAGGAESRNVQPVNATAASYWGLNICIRVGIPAESVLSNQKSEDGNVKVGLSLIISVTSNILLRSGPCSISHLIWQQAHPP